MIRPAIIALLLTGCAINHQPCEQATTEVSFLDLIHIRTCHKEE